MAFTVTPTSGAGPYVFTAVFAAKESLFTDRYGLEVRPRTSVGSCPAPAVSGTQAPSAEVNLLNTNSYTAPNPIAVGSCLVSTVVIRDLATGLVISQASAQVSNLA